MIPLRAMHSSCVHHTCDTIDCMTTDMLDNIHHFTRLHAVGSTWVCLHLQETFGAMAKTEKVAFILEQVPFDAMCRSPRSPAAVSAVSKGRILPMARRGSAEAVEMLAG